MPQPNVEQSLQLALQYQMSGRLQEAQTLCRQVLSVAPNHPAATHLLGAILTQMGKFTEAAELLAKVATFQPQNPAVHTSLGMALAGCQKLDEAIAACRRAIAIDANYARAHCNLGVALASKHQLEPAISSFERAIALQPNYPEALCNVAGALADVGRPEKAIESLQRAIALRPNYAQAYYNMGNALIGIKRLGPAIDAFKRAIQFKPDHAKAHGNLANAVSNVGRLDESIALYRKTLALDAKHSQVHSSLILTMHYHPGFTPVMIRQELERWNAAHAEPLAKSIRLHENTRSTNRRLRIGYVSPDLRRHSISRFLLPILENHDREGFEILAYSSVAKPDDVTGRLKGLTDVWREVAMLSDEALAERIRQDRIDVLVDLSLHTGSNRLLTFARKPAPVQMTYLAYCGTSGIKAMDYRLTDPYLDPPGGDESNYSERSLRLKSYWCYEPTGEEPPIEPLPAATNGYITFGCLNNYAKVTPQMLGACARLLRTVPNSRLILHMPAPEYFSYPDVDRSRVTLTPVLPTREYFAMHHRIDIALDPFPFGGGTTTCDALWMGVPVVSCTGVTAVSRAGQSILSNIGLPALVGKNVDEYLRIATELANDTPRLTQLRASLRQTMQHSPLMDAKRFTRDLEELYRSAWANYAGS